MEVIYYLYFIIIIILTQSKSQMITDCNICFVTGIAVVCFGDMGQLKPVRAKFIFDKPSCKDYHISYDIEPLWNTFDVINLVQNHRQGEDRSYAEVLNRIRVGKHTQI